MAIKKTLFLGLTALFSCALGVSVASFAGNNNETTVAHAQVGTTTKEEDSSIIAYTDASNWCFRTLHLYNVSFVEDSGYETSDFENFLNVYYGNFISSWANEGTTRGWGLNGGTAKDYMLCDGSTTTSHSFELPWWVQGFYFQVVNNTKWIGGQNNSGYQVHSSHGYHQKLSFSINYGNNYASLSNATITDKAKYNFPAVNINRVAVDVNTKQVIDTTIESDTSVIFNYYPNGDISASVPELSGYTYYGYYTDAQLNNQYTKTKFTEDTTLYVAYYQAFAEDTFYMVGSERGWNDTSKAGVFTKDSDTQYSLNNVSFIANEEWKLRKGTSGWINTSLYSSVNVIGTYMTKGDNMTVTESGASHKYNIIVNLNNSGNVSGVTIEFYYNNTKFCNMILDKTGSICETNQGNNGQALKAVWNELYTEYQNYPSEEKELFKNYTADETGNVYAKAAARYDYICSFYGTALEQDPKTYDYNFAGRTNAVKKSQVLSLNNMSNNTMIVIVVIGAISVLSVSGLILLKKKKAK